MELNKDMYNLLFFWMVADQVYSNQKIVQKNVPNRVEIIRDFENLFYNKQLNENYSLESNNVILSEDLLFSKLQKIIFKKLKNEYNYNETKNIILNDIACKNDLKSENLFDITNYWCQQKYGLI